MGKFWVVPAGLREALLKDIYKRSAYNRPLISVITVVLNGAQTIEKAIYSVIRQSYDNIEYLIIDGGSTDGTLNIIKRHSSGIDSWISESDQGIYDAMNKGVSLAAGEWIYFLGCDDVLLNCAEAVANHLTQCNTIYYGDVYMPGRHQLYNGKFNSLKLAWINICQQAIFYPRSIFDRHRFNLNYPLQADWEFNMRCWKDSEINFQYLPILISIFNDTEGSSAHMPDTNLERDYISILKCNFPRSVPLFFQFLLKCGKFLRKVGLLS